MIGYLKGKVLEATDGRVLLGIGSHDQIVGYSLIVSSADHAWVGEIKEYFIYTHVREDALDLFGFQSPIEKTLFLLLLQVNKVGPKMAMNLLSSLTVEQIVDAISSGNVEAFVKISGVGRKTAERLVLELQDSIHKKLGSTQKQTVLVSKPHSRRSSGYDDAVSALIGLGYKEADILQAISEITADQKELPTESLVRMALRELQA